MTGLFDPFTLKDVTLRNRIAVPPMCQYSAVDGVTNRWHFVHYPSIARGGAGLVIVERRGRERWNHLDALPIHGIHERWIGPYAAYAAAMLSRLKRMSESEVEPALVLNDGEEEAGGA